MAKAFGETVGRHERDRLAALLRQTRLEVGVHQRDLADRLGVPVSVLSKIERGHRGVDALELRAICAALGVPLADFVGRLERDLAAIERDPPGRRAIV